MAIRTVVAAAVGLVMSVSGASVRAQSLDLGELEATITGLSAPVGMYNAPGDSVNRLFIVQQTGLIRLALLNRATNPPTATLSTFLDVSASLVPTGGTITNPTVEDTPFGATRTQTGTYNRVRQNEQGLFSIAFHPDYNTPGALNEGVFFINYTGPRGVYGYSNSNGTCWDLGETRIVRYRRQAANPNLADTSTAKTILVFPQPYWNHNGGAMHFGPDGMLYIATGDGGSGGDPNNFAQNLNILLGKMLRINVSLQPGDAWSSFNYRVPSDNPYVGIAGLDEIWANGLRNPWRFSFDRLKGDLYIADVGQDMWEEINWVPGNGGPGRNYGWRRWESDRTYNSGTTLTPPTHTVPVYDYPHATSASWPQYTSAMTGASVSGGFCYWGKAIPGWRGRYFFADYVNARIWSVRMVNGVATDFQIHTTHLNTSPTFANITSFGQDNEGELYICQANGRLRKIIPGPGQPSRADVAQENGLAGPDGFVTGVDFDFFIQKFFESDPLADIATEGSTNLNAGPDGFITGTDFDAFIVLFFSA
ncbi:MAG: PQQ-dependent sugar dehydrogenase [Phycisphaeraceae bacterium]|nr:PQQ-dependent sugar dehydrogenase [Phycisphaeraceae bacterium]